MHNFQTFEINVIYLWYTGKQQTERKTIDRNPSSPQRTIDFKAFVGISWSSSPHTKISQIHEVVIRLQLHP